MPLDPDLARWLSDDIDLDAMERERNDIAERMQSMHETMAAVTTTVRSPDRNVEVTMAGSGAITDLTIAPRAFEELDHQQIAPLVLATVQKAMSGNAKQMHEAMAEFLPNGEVFDELMSDLSEIPFVLDPASREPDDADLNEETSRLLGHGGQHSS